MSRTQWMPGVLGILALATLSPVSGAPRRDFTHSIQPVAADSNTPGTLANRGFGGQPIKSVYFFAGDWRFPGLKFYDGPIPGVRVSPASNHCLYTIFPEDGGTHLGWSERPEKREHAIDLMLAAGVNVVTMSYWGQPHTDRWAFWAPMQTATGAHDELFDLAVGKPVFIAPSIESSIATLGRRQTGCDGDLGPVGRSPGFDFLEVFPGTPDNPAPALVEQIVDLVTRYVLHPRNPAWRDKWAQVFDREGVPRYVVSLIHVGSNQPGVTDETFAQGFAWVADRVHRETGVDVGFMLDALPPEHNARFKPSATRTGPALAQQPAVLAIQPFNPEVFTGRCAVGENCDAVAGSPQLLELLAWKERFISGWVSTGIPVILDVSPGYDARRVFEGAPQYGNNDAWRSGQANLLSLGVRGLTANTWNGYTEGYAIVPSCSAGAPPGLPPCDGPSTGADAAYHWFRGLTPPGGRAARLPAKLAGTNVLGAVYSDPITLTFRLTSFDLANALFNAPTPVPLQGKDIRVRLGNRSAAATTGDDGVAVVSMTVDQEPGNVPLAVEFKGDADYLPVEVRTAVVVAREATRLDWLDDVDATGPNIALAARLADDDGQPIVGRRLTFTVDSGLDARTCSPATDANGVARCIVATDLGERTVVVEFAGDAFYEPALTQHALNLLGGSR